MQKLRLVQVLLFLSLFSCGEILLIGAYDENVDAGIQLIAKDASMLFTKIKQNVTDDSDWSCGMFKDDYLKINAEINTLKIRVNGLEKYKIIESQIKELSDAILNLQKDHCSGFVKDRGLPKAKIIESIESDQSGVEVLLTSMIKLQNGLKREKVNSKK